METQGLENLHKRLHNLENENLDLGCKVAAMLNVLLENKVISTEELGKQMADVQLSLIRAREVALEESQGYAIKSTNETIAKGDAVSFGFDATVQGKQFHGGNVIADLIIVGRNSHIVDLERQMIGLPAVQGEHKLEVKLPDGQVMNMDLHILAVRTRVKPKNTLNIIN